MLGLLGSVRGLTACVLLGLAAVSHFAWGWTGVDLSVEMHRADWMQYMEANSNINVDFAMVRVYNDNATVTHNAAKTILGAFDAGIRNVSVYMFPCIPGSRWTAEKKLNCPTASEQLDEIINFLGINGIEFKSYGRHTWKPTPSPTRSPSASPTAIPTVTAGNPTRHPTAKPTFSPTAAPSADPTPGPTFYPTSFPTDLGVTFEPTLYPTSRPSFNPNITGVYVEALYIDVEDDNPTRYYNSLAANNIQFIAELVNYAWDNYGIRIGIYTTKREWGQIMGPVVGASNANPFAVLPLWTPRYDSQFNMDFFTGFAGWKHPYIKQLKGGASTLRRVGCPRINLNYIDEASLPSFFDPHTIPGPIRP